MLIATTLASTISAFAGSVIRPAREAFVDWARQTVNEVRRMNTNAATRRIVQTSQSKGMGQPTAGFRLCQQQPEIVMDQYPIRVMRELPVAKYIKLEMPRACPVEFH